MEEGIRFEQYVRKILIADESYRFLKIDNLKNIYSGLLDRADYPTLLDKLKHGILDEVPRDILPVPNTFCEYLDIYRFTDQSDKQYVATVYDNDELWQNPQIIDIIPL